jgi:type II restriction enzyme
LQRLRGATTVLLRRAQHQVLGDYGEVVVTRLPCPKCKHERTLRRLPVNFWCADIICDFCGYLAQVKATRQADVDKPPRSLMGSAWAPQKERMDAGISDQLTEAADIFARAIAATV